MSVITIFLSNVAEKKGGVRYKDDRGKTVTSTEIYYPPSSDTRAKSWYEREKADDEDHALYVQVYEWMSGVHKKARVTVQLHDMILFPVQASMDEFRPLFAAAGYDTTKPFLNKETSARIFTYIGRRDENRSRDQYLPLIMNLAMRPYGVAAQNVVQTRFWLEPINVTIGRYAITDVELNLILRGVSLEGDRERKEERWRTLMLIADPMVVLKGFYLMTNESPFAQYAAKQELVGSIWGTTEAYTDPETGEQIERTHSYGQFAVDMIRLEYAVRRRGEEGLISLFSEFYLGLTGFSKDQLFNYLIYARPGVIGDDDALRNMIYIAFVAINYNSGHVWLKAISADADTYYYLMDQAMAIWARQLLLYPIKYSLWGRDLLYSVIVHDDETFPASDGAQPSHLDTNRGMRVIIDNVPSGIVPAFWVDDTLIRARQDPVIYKKVTGVLKRYGLLDLKSTHSVQHYANRFGVPAPPMSVTDLIGVGNVDNIPALLERNMTIGAPLPNPAIVDKYWPDAAKTELTTWLRTTVGGAVERLYRPN
jgi:hypothetical protein